MVSPYETSLVNVLNPSDLQFTKLIVTEYLSVDQIAYKVTSFSFSAK